MERPAIRPDELKVTPAMLVPNAELLRLLAARRIRAHTEEEVVGAGRLQG